MFLALFSFFVFLVVLFIFFGTFLDSFLQLLDFFLNFLKHHRVAVDLLPLLEFFLFDQH